MSNTDVEQTFRYQTPVALPALDIPASSWLHYQSAAPQPGDVVFGLVYGAVSIGRVDQAADGNLFFRDGSSGETIPIRRTEDLRPFGVVVRVTSEFA